MNKIASCFVGVGLTALALSGFAAASATGVEPAATASAADGDSESGHTSVLGIGTEQVLPSTGDELAIKPATGAPDDSVDPYEEGFWERNQAPLGTATAAIEEQFPDEYAYAFFDDSSAMHVAFAGPAPTEAVALLHNTGLPYVIVESVGFNAAEYQAAAEDVVKQTLKYVTAERQVSVSPEPTIEPGTIKVSFQSTDPELTTDPGLTTPPQPVTVGAPFTITFDDTYTSPREFASHGRAAGR